MVQTTEQKSTMRLEWKISVYDLLVGPLARRDKYQDPPTATDPTMTQLEAV